jgi:hypothetical protein
MTRGWRKREAERKKFLLPFFDGKTEENNGRDGS